MDSLNKEVTLNRRILVGVTVLVLSGIASQCVWGALIGNPKPRVEAGKLYIGAGLSEMKRELKTKLTLTVTGAIVGTDSVTDTFEFDFSRQSVSLGYALKDDSIVEFQYGKGSVEDEEGGRIDGQEGGGVLRMNGLIAAFHHGTLNNENVEGSFTEINLGYGFAAPVSESAHIYGAVLISKLSSDLTATSARLAEYSAALTAYYGAPITATSAQLALDEDSAMGIIAGVEAQPDPKLLMTFEMHLLNETGFGAKLVYLF
jgi:hypothetical protein